MRPLIFLTICGALLSPTQDTFGQHQPPAFERATRVDATNTYGWDIGLDASGNPVVVGEAGSIINLGSTNIPHTSPGALTGMALRMTADGTFESGIGIIGVTGTSGVRIFGVDATSSDLIVCGAFAGNGETDFGGITLPPTNSQSGFIASYTSKNEISWILRAVPERSYECYIMRVESVGDGEILAVGSFSGSFLDINGTIIQKQPGPFDYDLVLLSLDSDGNLKWVTRYDGGEDEITEALTTDGAGNILVAGHFFSPELVFGETTLTKQGYYDGFVAKFDPAGNPLWARSIGTSGWDMYRAVVTDPHSNDVYVAGTLDLFGDIQFVLKKFSPDGDLLWEIQDTDENPFSNCYDLDIDSDGNCFACGESYLGGVVWKINPNGKVVWRKDTDNGAPEQTTLQSMVIAPDDGVFITGFFGSDQISLDGITIHHVGDPGRPTTFVAKLAADPPTIQHHLANDKLVLSWPTNQPGFLLEANATALQPQEWQAIAADVADGRNVATNALDQAGQVYRLKKEPVP